jgi:hypothetical protein
MNKGRIAILLLSILVVLSTQSGCTAKKGHINMGLPAIIYKTRADYSLYVPITLDSSKKEIVSFPGAKDIYHKGEFAYPIPLKKGYWLDNRGVGPNSAFLFVTYEEYPKLGEIPPIGQLMELFKDKDPFLEMYNLGDRNRFKNPIADINKIITNGELNKFPRLK